ncbi:MAG: TolC family protein [Phycisphaerales bacterium]|nr:TolC family protein [Phycisphaerales bacterium]
MSKVLACAILSLAVAGAGGCASPLASDREESDARIAKVMREAAARGEASYAPTVAQGVRELTTVPTDVATQPGPDGFYAPNQVGLHEARLRQDEPIVDLSLQECILRTCKNSLAIKVEAFNPAVREAMVLQAQAAFDPIFFGAINAALTDEPALTQGSGANGYSVQNQIGIKQLLPSGATAQAALGMNYRWLIPVQQDPNNPFNPDFQRSWTNSLSFTVSQPLARGFGAAVNEAQIYLAQRDRRISAAEFRGQVISILADTEAAYFNLILARTYVDIQQRLLNATELTYERVWARRDIDADKISLSLAKAACEARRAELIRARANLRSQSDLLKGMMNDPELDIRSNILINPTDRPTSELMVVSTADAIQTALQQRTELQAARLQHERADIIVRVTKNSLLPKVDLVVGIQTNSLQDDFMNAFGRVFDGNYIDYNAGIRIEIPLGNRQAEAQLVQYKHQRAQAFTQIASIAHRIVQNVKLQLRDILTYHYEIQARERVRLSAAEELLAISQKENIDALTPTFLQQKLDSQTRLASAEQALIQALVNYNIAMMRFEQAKGTLLEYNNISLERHPIARFEDDANKLRFMGETYLIR